MNNKRQNRIKRHARIKAKLNGTPLKPRVCIFKSNRYTYAQVIDDVSGKTLVSVHDMPKAKTKKKDTAKAVSAAALGTQLATKMKEKGIESAIFDKAGFKYHGRVKAVAEALREAGIKI